MLPIRISKELEVLLTVFENHQAYFLDINTLKPVSDLKFNDRFEIKEKIDDGSSSRFRSSLKRDHDDKTTVGALTIIDSHDERSEIHSIGAESLERTKNTARKSSLLKAVDGKS